MSEGFIAIHNHPRNAGILIKSKPVLRPKRSIIGPLVKQPKGVIMAAILAESRKS